MDLTFILALAGAVLAAASLVLHVIAPKTATTLDDDIVAKIDAVLALLAPKA